MTHQRDSWKNFCLACAMLASLPPATSCATGRSDPLLTSLSVPPETLPAWLDHDTAWSEHKVGHGCIKGIVFVYFRGSASVEEGRAALREVGGVVVGGQRLPGIRGGPFAVRVGGNMDKREEWAADRLRKENAVTDAFPICGRFED